MKRTMKVMDGEKTQWLLFEQHSVSLSRINILKGCLDDVDRCCHGD